MKKALNLKDSLICVQLSELISQLCSGDDLRFTHAFLDRAGIQLFGLRKFISVTNSLQGISILKISNGSFTFFRDFVPRLFRRNSNLFWTWSYTCRVRHT